MRCSCDEVDDAHNYKTEAPSPLSLSFSSAVVSDEAILGFEQNHSSMAIFLMSLYNELLTVLHVRPLSFAA
jgi:hypothetical protein